MANNSQNDLPLDITPHIEGSPDVDVADFYPAAHEGLFLDGEVYGLSYGIAPYVFYIKHKVFEAQGVDVPDPTLTFDEFQSLVRELNDPEIGNYGFTSSPEIMLIFPLMLSNGGRYVSEDES